MRTLAAVAVALFAFGIYAADKLPELKVPKITKDAPKIDGSLDDEAWKEAAVAEDFKLSDGEKPKGKCKLMVMRDDKNLYVAMECFEKEADLKGLKADITKHDEEMIWEDDDVELFIDPVGKRDCPYYQIIMNSKGTTWDACMVGQTDPDLTWEPKYEAKAKVGKTSWSVELAMPFTMFNKTEKSAAEWAFNVMHNRSNASEMMYWSAVFADSAHTPEKFGKLTGMPEMKTK
ncbi:MAG TPA: sugar-binding protein [Planctomycetota bacterium]|jgi:hypothetical protein